jgi:peptide/nickel transport system ATP-binding protein
MFSPLLEVGHLYVAARSRKGALTPIVKDVSFSVTPGKVIALIGETGSGKSTIALACMGYARAGCTINGGTVMLEGTNILALDFAARRRLRGTQVSYVAQSAAATFNAALTLDYQVTETPVVKRLLSRREAETKAVSLYRELDLPDPENIGRRYPHQVSGGQLQRFMAAMAMICDPKLLILDEPTTALDVTTQIEVLHAFKKLIREKRTSTIYVSHDLAVVAQVADEILVLKDGVMVEYGPVEQIIQAPVQDYSRMLLAAAHVMPKRLPASINLQSRYEPSTAPPLLEVCNVSAGYGAKQSLLALRSVSIEIRAGDTLGLIGESGSGKTTLGRVIAGLMRPKKGQVRLEGKVLADSIEGRRRDDLRAIQFAFQMADVALNPRHRIRKILGRPLRFYFGLSENEIDRRVAELLELVEIPASFARRYPSELSGGQRQRVNLARTLAAEPKLIICDEITSALDTLVGQAILDLLHDIQKRRKLAYIFISHDISLIAKISDNIAVMWNGKVVEQGSAAEVLTPPHHEYTQILLSSVPEMRTDWLDGVGAALPKSRGSGSLTMIARC